MVSDQPLNSLIAYRPRRGSGDENTHPNRDLIGRSAPTSKSKLQIIIRHNNSLTLRTILVNSKRWNDLRTAGLVLRKAPSIPGQFKPPPIAKPRHVVPLETKRETAPGTSHPPQGIIATIGGDDPRIDALVCPEVRSYAISRAHRQDGKTVIGTVLDEEIMVWDLRFRHA